MEKQLTKDNVREILLKKLTSEDYYPGDGDLAKENLAYLSGLADMANAVIRKITELGG
jgi:hypothetical protein